MILEFNIKKKKKNKKRKTKKRKTKKEKTKKEKTKKSSIKILDFFVTVELVKFSV